MEVRLGGIISEDRRGLLAKTEPSLVFRVASLLQAEALHLSGSGRCG